MNGAYAAPGGGQLQIRLLEDSAGPDEWQGQRVVFPVRPDGRLSGTGLLKVSGTVVVGHKKETAWEQQGITEIQAQTNSSCGREGSSRSAQTTQAAKLTLTNQTTETLAVYWLDFGIFGPQYNFIL